MKILFIGDIVGQPGRDAVRQAVPEFIKSKQIEFVIANAENAAGGSGITPAITEELFSAGIDVITSGDHIWKRREVLEIIQNENRLLRPANLAPDVPGFGFGIFNTQDGFKIAVINLQGRTFMQAIECPFRTARKLIETIRKETPVIVVDLHAEATSEKVAMGYFLDGSISALVGTHTHIQTADEKILPAGSAYITDVGMTGPCDSVIGRRKEDVIERFLTGMPIRFEVASEDIQLQAVIIEVDPAVGRALSIERVVKKISTVHQ